MALTIPEIPYRAQVKKFVDKLLRKINPRAIVLYGSAATGTFGVGSDVDILVVADGIPKGLLERLSLLIELNETSTPIEPLAYTPREFQYMLKRGHPAIFDALENGLVLYEDGFVRQMREKFSHLKQELGIVKTQDGWEKTRT